MKKKTIFNFKDNYFSSSICDIFAEPRERNHSKMLNDSLLRYRVILFATAVSVAVAQLLKRDAQNFHRIIAKSRWTRLTGLNEKINTWPDGSSGDRRPRGWDKTVSRYRESGATSAK